MSDVRDPEVLRATLEAVSSGSVSWSSATGAAVLQRIEQMARCSLGRTPVVVADPHLVSSTVSHVWERLMTGQVRFVIEAERPDRLLRVMVARTMVQVARAGAVCGADPSARNRRTPQGTVPLRLGEVQDVLEAAAIAEVCSPVVEELAGSIWRAVADASLCSGAGAATAETHAQEGADALRYVVDEVSACGIATAHRRLAKDKQLAGLLPWWSARALVWAVTGSTSGQGSWDAARASVFALLHVARQGRDRRSIAAIAPEWTTVLARVTAAFRTDLTLGNVATAPDVEEQVPLPGLAVVL